MRLYKTGGSGGSKSERKASLYEPCFLLEQINQGVIRITKNHEISNDNINSPLEINGYDH